MSGPRGMFAKIRSGNIPFFAVRTPLTGCGFALAFGWLWFPVLRDIVLPGLFAGRPLFHPSAFGLALGAGCLLCGPLCGRLENGGARQGLLNAVLAHGVPALLLCLFLLVRSTGMSFVVLDATLAGLAGALPGIWWTSRLLASGPGKAVAALAWAAFTALILSLPLPRQQPDSTDTICLLAAGLALACLAALFLVRRDREEDARSETAAPLTTPHRFDPSRGIYAVLLCGVASIFFSLGSLSVLAHETGGAVQAIARLCALTAAVFFLDGPIKRIVGIAACALAVLAFCLSLSPELAPMLFPVGAGLLEAAGVALCAAALLRGAFGRGAAASMAGLFLTVTLTAVNGGYLAGWELTSFTGDMWPVLPGLAAALLLAAAAYQGRKHMTEEEPALEETKKDPPQPSAASDTAESTTAMANSSIAEQLTKRELALALLLVEGYNNKAAAERLGMAENTLRWHIKNLNKKIGSVDRDELISVLKNTTAIQG